MTPSLKELALAAVEARKNYDKTDHSLNNEFFEWQKVKELFSIYATPERILQYRDEVLEEAARCAEMTPIAGMKSKTGVPDKIAAAIRSLKSKEPSP